MSDDDSKLDIPTGMSNPWKFVQKRIIFENKIIMVEAVSKYHKVFARDKENDAMLQDAIISMRQLFLEIKEVVKKNKKCKKDSQKTIEFMDKMIKDQKRSWTSDDFPEIYDHYVGLLDMLVYIGLTDIESKGEDPGEALMNTNT